MPVFTIPLCLYSIYTQIQRLLYSRSLLINLCLTLLRVSLFLQIKGNTGFPQDETATRTRKHMLLGVCHVIFSNRWASLGSSLRFALRGVRVVGLSAHHSSTEQKKKIGHV
jgi:hypothetical protein